MGALAQGLKSFDLIELSRRLIGIRSTASEGTREVVEFLAPFCRGLGFEVTLQSAGNGGAAEVNLIAHTVPRDSADLCPGGLLLVTHLDTVPPGDPSLWTEGDPFRATIKGDRIYGLGSADTKLDFLCKLKALEGIGLGKIKVPLALVGTFGEERALAGARLIRESGLLHPRLALIGEPSGLEPVVAHKGLLYLKAVGEFPAEPVGGSPAESLVEAQVKEFRGRAAHGSTPHLGENAITKAVGWLLEEAARDPTLHLVGIEGGTVHNIVPADCRLRLSRGGDSCRPETGQGPVPSPAYGRGTGPCPKITFLNDFFHWVEAAESSLTGQENRDFDPPGTTCNVGVIRSGSGRIEIEFDFRLIPETDGNTLFELFRRLSERRRGVTVEVVRSNPPMKTERDSEVARRVGEALRAVGCPVRYLSKPGNTEGTIFNGMGAESIVIGPGRSTGNIHAPNEYNEIAQLQKAVEFYEAFLRQFT